MGGRVTELAFREWIQMVRVETGMGCFGLQPCQKGGYVKEPQVVEIYPLPPNLQPFLSPLPCVTGVASARNTLI